MEKLKIDRVIPKDNNGIYNIDDVKKAYEENQRRIHCYKLLKKTINAYRNGTLNDYISECNYDELCEILDIMIFMKYDYYEIIGKITAKIHEYECDIFIDMIKNIDERNFEPWFEKLTISEIRMLKKALFTFNFGNDNKNDKYVLMEDKINKYYKKIKNNR